MLLFSILSFYTYLWIIQNHEAANILYQIFSILVFHIFSAGYTQSLILGTYKHWNTNRAFLTPNRWYSTHYANSEHWKLHFTFKQNFSIFLRFFFIWKCIFFFFFLSVHFIEIFYSHAPCRLSLQLGAHCIIFPIFFASKIEDKPRKRRKRRSWVQQSFISGGTTAPWQRTDFIGIAWDMCIWN